MGWAGNKEREKSRSKIPEKEGKGWDNEGDNARGHEKK